MPTNPTTSKIVSKKHLARVERERIQRRRLILGVIVVAVAIVAIILYGILDQTVLYKSKAISTVNGDKITVTDFQAFYRFQEYFARLIGTTDPESIAQRTLSELQLDLLYQQKAAELGVSVSEADLDRFYQEFFGYFPQGTPTPAPTAELLPTSTLSPTQQALLSGQPVTEETAEATATEAPTPEAEPTEYTRALYEANITAYFDGYAQFGVTKETLDKYFRSTLLRREVGKKLTEGLSEQEEMVWARQILVSDKLQAQDIAARLKKGADWYSLVETYSKDTATKTQGGDLGWIGTGQTFDEIQKVIFALEIGETTDPIRTALGYHILQVLGKETRQMTAAQFSQLRENTITKWENEARANAAITAPESLLDFVPPALTSSN